MEGGGCDGGEEEVMEGRWSLTECRMECEGTGTVLLLNGRPHKQGSVVTHHLVVDKGRELVVR